MFGRKATMIEPERALPGRAEALVVRQAHHVNGHPLQGPYPEGTEQALFGMGCFWGAERVFWQTPGVWVTAVGYAGGFTPNPTYEEVCSGRTGHAEVVLVVFDLSQVTYDELLRLFWERHDPTQGMRQGNDVGTQYRSGIWWYSDAQRDATEESQKQYEQALGEAGFPAITTEIGPAPDFYFAEGYHQQYLSTNPGGYCGLSGTGVGCAIAV